MAIESNDTAEEAMDMPEPHQMFRCPRCWHTELESGPPRTQCPQCGLAIPPPQKEQFLAPQPGLLLQEE